jgi:AraC family transcriptional regulator
MITPFEDPASRQPEHHASAAASRGLFAHWQVERLSRYIDAHLDRAIRVEDLGNIVHLSSHHFSRVFSRTFGQSPHAYLMHRRTERAVLIMREGYLQLADVAQSCGFADQAHFSRVFRRFVGQSPSVWQRERREGRSQVEPRTSDRL